MKPLLAIFASGFIFAIGLVVSGMTDANKVIGFLNLAGKWDPSLGFVMVGAIGMHLALFRWILKRDSPVFAEKFGIPTRKDIDLRLVLGAAIFGAGWGLGGFCPGPALTSVATLATDALVFVGTMLVGMMLFHGSHRLFTRGKE